MRRKWGFSTKGISHLKNPHFLLNALVTQGCIHKKQESKVNGRYTDSGKERITVFCVYAYALPRDEVPPEVSKI